MAVALVFLIFESLKCVDRECERNVSYVSHAFGALSGFIMGIIFLRARYLRKTEKRLKYGLLLIAYGLPLSYVLIQYGRKFKTYHTGKFAKCPLVHWSKYEKACQEACYNQHHENIEEPTCQEIFTIHNECALGKVTFNNASIAKC